VVLGLMACDTTSYFTANPGFDPGAGYSTGHFLLWADAIDPRAFEAPEEEPEDGGVDEEPEVGEPGYAEKPEVEEPEDAEEPELLEPGEAPDPAATSPVPGPVT
jgi:hypothetical protein